MGEMTDGLLNAGDEGAEKVLAAVIKLAEEELKKHRGGTASVKISRLVEKAGLKPSGYYVHLVVAHVKSSGFPDVGDWLFFRLRRRGKAKHYYLTFIRTRSLNHYAVNGYARRKKSYS